MSPFTFAQELPEPSEVPIFAETKAFCNPRTHLRMQRKPGKKAGFKVLGKC